MKQTLVLTAAWPGPRGLMQPGQYAIPGEISRPHARCAVADGCGEIMAEAGEKEEPFREAETKQPAPENKGRGVAPENKSPVDDSRGGGDRAKPDAGSGKRPARAKRSGGQ